MIHQCRITSVCPRLRWMKGGDTVRWWWWCWCWHGLLSGLPDPTHPELKGCVASFVGLHWPSPPKTSERVIWCFRPACLWRITWSELAIFSHSAGVDTDLWVITLGEEAGCVLLIANERISSSLVDFDADTHLSLCSDGGGQASWFHMYEVYTHTYVGFSFVSLFISHHRTYSGPETCC